MAKKTIRPLRTLLIFGLTTAVLYGLAALGGTWKPQLGLDLEGGTRITLTAIPEAGTITAAKMKEAAGIIDARVNGSGVAEAEVTTQGDRNIVVEIPGKNAGALVDQVKRTAQLRFRLVVGQPQPGRVVAQPSPSPSGSPSGSPSPGASPSAEVPLKPQASQPTATPKSRPAPALDSLRPAATPTPVVPPTGPASPAVPAPTPTTPPQQQLTTEGAPVNQPEKWVKDPGTAWLTKYAKFTCPAKGADSKPILDKADEPLITCDSDGNKYLLSAAMIEGTSLKSASSGIPQNSTSYAVLLKLKGPAVGVFSRLSNEMANTGELFAIVLDGKVLSAPTFDSRIPDGNAQITGNFTQESARDLANSLKFGALPIKFGDPSIEIVGPSLAGNQLSAGILAGIIGLAIVMLYCLIYYRGLGLVVIASLFVAAIVTYATVLVLAHTAGFTLTLPGIAGLIVAVGITADSFIVYFERIRDEMRDGKSMRVAVEAGWVRARNTCLAADAVSFLAAVVLYIFAIGVVRGFAFTLGISTLIDVAVFFFFTKPMVTLLAKREFFNTGHRMSGLSKETLGMDEEPGLMGGRA